MKSDILIVHGTHDYMVPLNNAYKNTMKYLKSRGNRQLTAQTVETSLYIHMQWEKIDVFLLKAKEHNDIFVFQYSTLD